MSQVTAGPVLDKTGPVSFRPVGQEAKLVSTGTELRKRQMINRLYRYRAINKFSISELTAARYYFASPFEFNDPFECKNVHKFNDLPERDTRLILKKYFKTALFGWSKQDKDGYLEYLTNGNENIRRLNRLHDFEAYISSRLEGYGIYCLSEKPDNILMWSHYADSHKGMCLVFDADIISKHFNCQPVKYKSTYPSFKQCLDSKKNLLNLAPLILTKSKHWKYESEVRLIVEPEFINEVGAKRLIKIPSKALVGVIFGCESSYHDKDIIREILKRKSKKVEFYDARKSSIEFSLVINPEKGILAWEQLSEVPYSIYIPYTALTVKNDTQETPPEIQARYLKMWSPGDLVVWATGKYCGIKIEEFEKVWQPELLKGAKLSFCQTSDKMYDVVIKYRGKIDTIFHVYDDETRWHREVAKGWLVRFGLMLERVLNITSEIN